MAHLNVSQRIPEKKGEKVMLLARGLYISHINMPKKIILKKKNYSLGEVLKTKGHRG